MAVLRQLTLDLPQRPALGREDFVVAPCNETAVAWIDRWPDWPQPVLAVHGPSGAGKSHLAQVWRRASGAQEVSPEAFETGDPPTLAGDGKAVLIEDVDRLLATGDPAREERLLHLYNLVIEARGQLLLTAESAPARWPCGLPDLRSRLAAAQAVALGAPDARLIEALLVKLFSDRQLRVSAPVVKYLVPRIERSFAALQELVGAIDDAALSNHRDISVSLVRRVLETIRPETETDAGEESHGSRD